MIMVSFFTLEVSNAQTLKVTYTEKLDLSKKLAGVENPMIKQMILEKAGAPKYFDLTNCNQTSVYEIKQIDEESNSNSNSNVLVMGTGVEGDIIYRNYKTNKFIRQTDFMSRTFLIEGKLLENDWKITSEAQKIGNYLCRKAVLKQDTNEIIAWFTDEIPSNDGPREYYGLPGLVLKVQTTSSIIEATNIVISKEKVELKKPTKGKKVTREEFQKIKKEKLENLTGGQKNNGNGVQIIKM